MLIPEGIDISSFNQDKKDGTNQGKDRIVGSGDLQNIQTASQWAAITYYKVSN